MSDKLRTWYLEHRKTLADASADQIARFENAILAASGAGTAATFYLLTQNPKLVSLDLSLIKAATFFFALSFGLILLSNFTSHREMENELKLFDQAYREKELNNISASIWNKITLFLNVAAPASLLICGVLLFIVLLQ